ncbi:MAG: DUF4278 domain-containing protein [Bosea sp. (in: a-proteobacteria)]
MLKKIATTTALLIPAAAHLGVGQPDAQNKVKDSPMTNLIYRGMKHDGQRTAISHKPQNLIYRGVVHDGLPTAAMPVRNSHADLCYRGNRYTLAANGDVLYGAHTFSTGRLA